MAVKRQNLKKTESIQSQVISAINKADNVIKSVPKVLEEFDKIKEEVESAKTEMDLGLKQHEASIEEQKQALNDLVDEAKINADNQINTFNQQVSSSRDNMSRELEQLRYDHKIAIERDSLDTAEKIATKFGKVILDVTKYENFEQEKEDLKQSMAEIHEAELKEKSRGYAIAENKVKSEYNQRIVVLETQLASSESRVIDLLQQIDYLKAQVDSERTAGTDRITALKSDVIVNNDNTGKK